MTTATTRLPAGVDLGLYISTGIELQDNPVAEHILHNLHMNTFESFEACKMSKRSNNALCASPEDFMVQGCPGTMKRNGDNFHPPLMPKRSPPAARRTRGGLSATARFLRSLGKVLLGYF